MVPWRKPVAIVNPRAAGGKAEKRLPEVSRCLGERLGSVEVFKTESSGHASRLARDALKAGADLIIAVGGDGTANEVVNGFFDNSQAVRPDACLGFIPFGTGGDLQRTLEIPSDVERAVDILAAAAQAPIDVGKAAFAGHDGAPLERYFVNLLSLGLGGDVAVRAKNFLSPLLGGKVAFLYATVAGLVRFRGKRVRLTLDEEPAPSEFFISNIAIGNGRYHGGGMHPCPRAVMNDGLLDVTTIDYLTMLEFLRDIKYLYSDDIYRHPKARHFRARKIVAESDETTHIEIDGEALGRLPLEINLLPSSLRVVVPSTSELAGQ